MLEKSVKLIGRIRTRGRWLGYILAAGAFFYLIYLLFLGGIDLSQIDWQGLIWPVILVIGIYLLSQIPQYLLWSRLISFHHQVTWKDVVIYARSLIIRRLPGGVWHWVDRSLQYSSLKLQSARVVVLANFIEWLLLLLTAGMIILAGLSELSIPIRLALLAIPVVAFLGLSIYWQPEHRPLHWKILEGIFWIVLDLAAWLFGGLVVVVLTQAVRPDLATLDMFHAVWIWALTGGSSLLMLIIPSGLGIREVALTLLLEPYLTHPEALLVALLIRIAFILADLVWGGIGLLLTAGLNKPGEQDIPAPESNHQG